MQRVLAVQLGARHNYAVPSVLESAGKLEAFYTDACADAGLARHLRRVSPGMFRRGAIGRLLNRNVPANIKGKVKTFDWITARYLLRHHFSGDDPIRQHKSFEKFGSEFGKAMIRSGVGSATHVYSMFGEGTEFLRFARGKGVKILVEIFINPLAYEIMQAEKKLHPELEDPIETEVVRDGYKWFNQVLDVADIFIVPSLFVQEGMQKFGIAQERCRIVPYAVNDSWFDIKPSPIKGRILFVGTAEMRKGIHVMGEAARELSGRGYEFRIAGGVSQRIAQSPKTKGLAFLGRIPRAEIQQEYAQADVFVLPSLAEGSAGATYEALAAGVPVITTKSAGSVVRDGVDGFIVPERDAKMLAARIEEVVENRELRASMSEAARERAGDYTWERYSSRLLRVIDNS